MINFSEERIAAQMSDITTDDNPPDQEVDEPSKSDYSQDHTGAKRWG